MPSKLKTRRLWTSFMLAIGGVAGGIAAMTDTSGIQSVFADESVKVSQYQNTFF